MMNMCAYCRIVYTVGGVIISQLQRLRVLFTVADNALYRALTRTRLTPHLKYRWT